MNPDTKRFLQLQMMWIGISLAISIAISMVVPFPLNILGIIGVFIALNYFMRQRQMRKMGMTGGGGSGSFFGMGSGSLFGEKRT